MTEASTGGEPGAEKEAAALEAESAAHDDLIYLDVARGFNFPVKLLAAMRAMHERYTFDFFLKLDDDYFLCIQRLLNELEILRDAMAAGKQAPLLYGGYFRCEPDNIRADEAFLLLSTGAVQRAVATPDLECIKFAGMTAGWWFTAGNALNKNGDVQHFDDPRLDHYGNWWLPVRRGGARHDEFAAVCQTHMGVHFTYAGNMVALWEEAKNTPGPQDVGVEALTVYSGSAAVTI